MLLCQPKRILEYMNKGIHEYMYKRIERNFGEFWNLEFDHLEFDH